MAVGGLQSNRACLKAYRPRPEEHGSNASPRSTTMLRSDSKYQPNRSRDRATASAGEAPRTAVVALACLAAAASSLRA
eukprot:2838578-Pyramimonas_sp.AAC.1